LATIQRKPAAILRALHLPPFGVIARLRSTWQSYRHEVSKPASDEERLEQNCW